MSIIILAIFILILTALACYAVQLLPIPSPFNRLIQALVVVLATLYLGHEAGLF